MFCALDKNRFENETDNHCKQHGLAEGAAK